MTLDDYKQILLKVQSNYKEVIGSVTNDQINCSVNEVNFTLFKGCNNSCVGIQANGLIEDIDLNPDNKEEFIDLFNSIVKQYKDTYINTLIKGILECL